MKTFINRSLVLVSAVIILSQVAYAESCTYELAKDSLTVGYTAFKTTQKLGVNGSFKKTEVTGKTQGKSLAELASTLQVRVDAASSDTTNPARDLTLKEFFFSKLKGGITGSLKGLNEKEHTVLLTLGFNDKQKDVPLKYEVTEEKNFKATGSIDLLEFGANDAYNSIHKKCEDLHKGPDGVSKTWTDVSINLKATINKVCR